MVKYLTPIDLNKNEIQNVVIQNLALAPESPKSGQIYFDTTSNKFKVFDGSTWVDVSGGSDEETHEFALTTQMFEDSEQDVKNKIADIAFVNSESQQRSLINEIVNDGLEEIRTELNNVNNNYAERMPSLVAKLSELETTTEEERRGLQSKIKEVSKTVIAEMMEGAPEDLNTWTEIAEAIQNNKDALSRISNVTRKFTTTIDSGDTVTITHNLGTKLVNVSVYDKNGNFVIVDHRLVDDNSLVITGISEETYTSIGGFEVVVVG